MTDLTTVPLHPEHPSAQAPDAPAPLYKSKKAFLTAQQQLLDYLEETYPQHFGKQGQPWAIGMRDEIIIALSSTAFEESLIRHTLHYFSRSVRYLTNCILSGYGAPRYHLNGEQEGNITRRELIFALTQLSGLVQRKDPVQAENYRVWSMREMVLGLLHGDLTEEELERAKVRKKVVKRASELAAEPEQLDRLQLRNKRTGKLHPSVYASPYLPTNLHKAFQLRHPEHVTSGKLKNKSKSKRRARVTTVTMQKKRQERTVTKSAMSAKGPSFTGHYNPNGVGRPVSSERTPKQTTVVVKKRRRFAVPGPVGA